MNSKLVDLMLYESIDDINQFNQYYISKLNYLNNLKKYILNEEPFFIFKKKHKCWEEEMKEIDAQISKTCTLIERGIDDVILIKNTFPND